MAPSKSTRLSASSEKKEMIVSASPQSRGSSRKASSTGPKPLASPESVISALKKNTLFYFPLTHPPHFNKLFPDQQVPSATGIDNLDSSVLNTLILKQISKAKKFLSSEHLNCPRVPQEFFNYTKSLIVSSIVSSQGKAPPKAKPSSTSVPPANKTKGPSPLTTKSTLDLLKKCDSPRFYFDEQPGFSSLFPRTSVPKHHYVSGNVVIDKAEFSPLLSSRLASAKKFLSKNGTSVPRLPSSFVQYQIRLLSRSVMQQRKDISDKRKLTKKEKKQKAPPTSVKIQSSDSKHVVFQPASVSVNPSSPPQSAQVAPVPLDDSAPIGSSAYWRKVRPLLEVCLTYLKHFGDQPLPSQYSQALIHSGCLPLLFQNPEPKYSDAVITYSYDDQHHAFTLRSPSHGPPSQLVASLNVQNLSTSLDYVRAVTNLALTSSLSDFSSPYPNSL